MWHKPQLLDAIADLLFVAGAAALLFALLAAAARLPLLPVREVVVTEALKQTRRAEIERSLTGLVGGNFLAVNLDAIRGSLERLPWVRRAEVRRRWPATIELAIEEHVPVARWGEARSELVNGYGEIFAAAVASDLPVLYGPAGSSQEVLRRYRAFTAALAPLGHVPTQVLLSERLAWQVRLDDGMLIEIGREQPKSAVDSRLADFVTLYPAAVVGRKIAVVGADLRYPNGFALRLAAAPGIEGKGKQ